MAKLNQIFTICTGRCGQVSVADYLNTFGLNCHAEVEPPEILYKAEWPFGSYLRNFQRKYIFTHELLGRGKAFEWYDNDQDELIDQLVSKRMKNVHSFNREIYIELSKFFIRSYCDGTYRYNKNIGILNLRRNPMANARSFSNRGKNYAQDGLMPEFKKSIFKIDFEGLSLYEIYLWQWIEIELRGIEFIERNKIKKKFLLKTEEINDPRKMNELFNYFGIEKSKDIYCLEKSNTNIEQGLPETETTEEGKGSFKKLLEKMPTDLRSKIDFADGYL